MERRRVQRLIRMYRWGCGGVMVWYVIIDHRRDERREEEKSRKMEKSYLQRCY
jgi:hypothetical protein